MCDSRFGRRGCMTSNVNWSDRTDQSAPPQPIPTGLGASPSQVIAGDDYIAENSDLFREAIAARNVYAAWARKLTNARPNDPKMQSYHQEVTLAGETVNSTRQAKRPTFPNPSLGETPTFCERTASANQIAGRRAIVPPADVCLSPFQ
ncbi:hypothetical protein TNCV_4534921 [Trichonephila clavipes]|nr:hypothetical protein TNCV_4534921 [Trichonephila clavipes]